MSWCFSAMSNLKVIVKKRPRSYPMLHQQTLMQEACAACGIQKGITRAELVDRMKNCLPEFYRKKKEEAVNQPPPGNTPTPSTG